jgi:hypothetical protein
MLFMITTTYDTTCDLLIHYMKSEKIFRFNTDIFHDYKISLTERGFHIEDPTGRSISDANISKVFWRKPLQNKDLLKDNVLSEEQLYYDEELWYSTREMVNLLWADGKIVLVEPFAGMRAGKFVQLKVAAQYFKVPQYQFRLNYDTAFSKKTEVIVKSLTMEPVTVPTHEVLFATRVKDKELSPQCPWMVQEYVPAEADITVVFVRDKIFAFELDRTKFINRTADWRELPVSETSDQWQPHELPSQIQTGIFSFMRDLGLHFGRLDFLLSQNDYFFLEVNPNGQWAWLDSENKLGLTKKVIEELSPDNPCYGIPVKRLP